MLGEPLFVAVTLAFKDGDVIMLGVDELFEEVVGEGVEVTIAEMLAFDDGVAVILGVNDPFDDGVNEADLVVVADIIALALIDAFGEGLDEEDGIELIVLFELVDALTLGDSVIELFDETLPFKDTLALGDEDEVTDGFEVGVAVELIVAFGDTDGDATDDGVVVIDALDDPEGDSDAVDDNAVMFDALGDALPLAVAVVLLDAVGLVELVAVGDTLDDTFDVGLSDVVGVVVIELLGVVEMFKGAETLGELLVVEVALAFEDGVPVMLGVNDAFEDGVREADLVVVADAVALPVTEMLVFDDGFKVGVTVKLLDALDDSDGEAIEDGVVDAINDVLGDELPFGVVVSEGESVFVSVAVEDGVSEVDKLKVSLIDSDGETDALALMEIASLVVIVVEALVDSDTVGELVLLEEIDSNRLALSEDDGKLVSVVDGVLEVSFASTDGLTVFEAVGDNEREVAQ